MLAAVHDHDAGARRAGIRRGATVGPYVDRVGGRVLRSRTLGIFFLRSCFTHHDLDSFARRRAEIPCTGAIGLGPGNWLVNDLHTPVAIRDKCTCGIDLCPDVAVAETVTKIRHQAGSITTIDRHWDACYKPRTSPLGRLFLENHMVRFRKSWLVAVVALGLGAAACKKNDDNKAGDKPAGDKVADKTDVKAADKAATTPDKVAPIADANASDLSLLPVDSEVVMGLNIGQLQSSALWKQFSPKIMDKISGGLGEFKAKCGFDPLESIKSIAIGMKGLGGGTPDGAVVVHGPDKAKVMACLDKGKADAAAKGTEITIDGDVFTIKDKKGTNTAFTFVNDTTILGIIGANGTKDGVLAAAKGTSALKSSATFVDMYSKINTQDSLWMLMNGNSPALAKMGAMGVKPKAIFGSINLTDGLTVDMRIRVATPAEASGFVDMMKGQINNPQVKQMFDKLDMTADGPDTKVAVAMSSAKLQALVGMAQGMLGGMMGGGGGMGGGMGGP